MHLSFRLFAKQSQQMLFEAVESLLALGNERNQLIVEQNLPALVANKQRLASVVRQTSVNVFQLEKPSFTPIFSTYELCTIVVP
jgi:hypothetical protein